LVPLAVCTTREQCDRDLARRGAAEVHVAVKSAGPRALELLELGVDIGPPGANRHGDWGEPSHDQDHPIEWRPFIEDPSSDPESAAVDDLLRQGLVDCGMHVRRLHGARS
jgi:hypothetical protein